MTTDKYNRCTSILLIVPLVSQIKVWLLSIYLGQQANQNSYIILQSLMSANLLPQHCELFFFKEKQTHCKWKPKPAADAGWKHVPHTAVDLSRVSVSSLAASVFWYLCSVCLSWKSFLCFSAAALTTPGKHSWLCDSDSFVLAGLRMTGILTLSQVLLVWWFYFARCRDDRIINL